MDRLCFNVSDKEPSDPTARLIESYAYKIGYIDDTGGEEQSHSRKNLNFELIGSGKNNSVSVYQPDSKTTINKEEIHSALQSMIKSLVLLTSSLPPLPNRRFLSMTLYYNDTVPFEYEPPVKEERKTKRY